jgi:hypothetical protein
MKLPTIALEAVCSCDRWMTCALWSFVKEVRIREEKEKESWIDRMNH